MKNFVANGKNLELTAPSGGVVSGKAYLIGGLVVIATHDAAETVKFRARVVGAVDHAKEVSEAWSEGLKIYWDDTGKEFTSSASGNTLAGVAVKPIVPVALTLATDAAPGELLISGFTLQVLAFAALTGATVTVTVNAVATVLTEGVDWTAATSDDATATSLASAINGVDGVTAAAVTDTVTVTRGTGISAPQNAVGRVRLDGATR